MSNSPTTRGCQLADGRLSPPALTPAILISDFPYLRLPDVERLWTPARQQLASDMASKPLDLESGHWNWLNKIRSTYADIHRLFAIECEGEVQGLMTLEAQPHFASLRQGSHLIYVDFLESAPWNLRSPKQAPRFFGVGTLLIGEAVRESLRLGHEGRVGLHALPQAERFYSINCRMSRLFVDPTYHNLAYFEYPDGVAAQWLVDKGLDQ